METNLLDILWIIVASSLVFIMQAGFAMVESGLTRSKNNINVAIKNLTDLGVSTIFFWAGGFALMFGATWWGVIGVNHFLFHPRSTWSAVFFLFQSMFCATSATIVSGAIAERVRYSAYIMATIFLSALVYPIFGHWAWGGAMDGSGPGWLGALGFVDFAGSTVVHSLGGWVALAILFIVGPRTGRYDENGKPRAINGSNIPMAVLGVLILWFGWFGFNGGSTLAMDASVAGIILRTTLSASAAMVATLAAGWVILKKPDVTLVMNGALAGLVAITAPAHAVNEWQSIIIGIVGGLVMLGAVFLLDRLKIDDAVSAIPVHMAAGVWGTLAVGLFGNSEILGTGLHRLQQTGVQLLGIVVCGAWAFGSAYLFLKLLNRILPLRVSLDGEIAGLNRAEHGVSTEILDLYTTLHRQAETGDLSLRAPVEPFTEVGQIAGMYNTVMDKLEEDTVEIDEYLHILTNVSDGMFLLSKDGTIGQYYSKSLERILESESLADRSLAAVLEPVLPGSVFGLYDDFIELAFDPKVAWRNVERLNPLREVEANFDDAKGGFTTKRLEFDFKRIDKDRDIARLLVLVRDVTEEHSLNQEIRRTREEGRNEMELLYRILHVEPGMLKEFLAGATENLSAINKAFQRGSGSSRARLQEAFRLCHAVKGDAGLLELDFISEKAEAFEQIMQKMLARDDFENEDFIPLTLKLSELQKTVNQIEGLLRKWGGLQSGLAVNMNTAEDPPERGYEGEFFASSLARMVERLSARYEKQAHIDLSGFALDDFQSEHLKPVREIIVQLTRNAIYHGIETPEVRAAITKEPYGTIRVQSERTGRESRIVFSDDGAGLDIRRIRAQALENGLITAEDFESLPDSHIPRFIFASGFSTAETSDSVAGKGVGMPLVRELVGKLGGSIGIRTRRNRLCRFVITIPSSAPVDGPSATGSNTVERATEETVPV